MAGQVIKKSEGRWLVRWYLGRVDGKRRYGSRVVHGTKRQAQRALRETLARQDRGHAVPSPSNQPTLREYVDRWQRGNAAATLRARTLRGYLASLERHVFPKVGAIRLDSVTSALIEAEVVAPLRKKGHLRAARLAVAALSRVYRSALKDSTLGLSSNPCRGVEFGKETRRESMPLDASERARFREAIGGTEHESLWLLMMLTGLGPGEALGLGWEHVDLTQGHLRVARTLDCKSRELVAGTKRESRKRVVPLVPELRGVLRERWLVAGRPDQGLLFANSVGEPLDLDNLRRHSFTTAKKRAGIERPFRIYDLRHGFATAGLQKGLDVKTVADLMGHSSVRTTLDVYQHVSDERKREAIALIAEELS